MAQVGCFYHTMLCHIMTCYAMPHHAVPYHATPHHATPHHTIPGNKKRLTSHTWTGRWDQGAVDVTGAALAGVRRHLVGER